MKCLMDEMYDCAHDYRILLSLTIELTTMCNERCVHCYIPHHDNKGLNITDIKRVIKEFRDMGGLNLTLTGGEIFLRKDIFEIIEYARQLNLRVFLLTNGTLITQKVIDKLKMLNIAELSISVYSLDDQIHDSITRKGGSLKETLNAIELAGKNSIRVTVKTPLMENNKYAYRELQKYCKERNISYLASCIIFSKNNGDTSVKDTMINEDEQRIIAREVEKLEPNGRRYNYEEACGSLKYTLGIDSLGNIYPCSSFYYKLGNVKDDSLEEIWNSETLKKIQDIRKDELHECSECSYKEKCSRCPGLAYLEDNTLYACSSTAKQNVMARI